MNCHVPLVAEMPHGGFTQSGYCKDLSAYSLEDHTRVKHVMSYVGEWTGRCHSGAGAWHDEAVQVTAGGSRCESGAVPPL